jgi:hypothetical protein
MGNKYRFPWRALIIRKTHRIRLKIQARVPMTGIHPMMSKMRKIMRKAIVDCLAWNLTKRLSLSTNKKTIPVTNQRR